MSIREGEPIRLKGFYRLRFDLFGLSIDLGGMKHGA